MLPERARVDEGLVVEARRQEARKAVVQHPDIELERGPVVLALRAQPVEKRGGCGPRVGLHPGAVAQRHQRVRLLGARGHDAARAVVLEGPAHQHLAVGQERRGERVARVPGEALAVEGEGNRAAAVDAAAAGGQTGAHRQPSHSGRFFLIWFIKDLGGSVTCAG